MSERKANRSKSYGSDCWSYSRWPLYVFYYNFYPRRVIEAATEAAVDQPVDSQRSNCNFKTKFRTDIIKTRKFYVERSCKALNYPSNNSKISSIGVKIQQLWLFTEMLRNKIPTQGNLYPFCICFLLVFGFILYSVLDSILNHWDLLAVNLKYKIV